MSRVTAQTVRQEVAEAVANGFDVVIIVSHHGFTDGAHDAADAAEINCWLSSEGPI